MCKRSALVLIFPSIFPLIFTAFFAALPCWAWNPITSGKRTSCEESSPCIVKQIKSGISYRVIFQTAQDGDVTLIKQVQISDEKNKATDSFEMKNMSGIFAGESYDFQSLDLNNDGYTDLALMAFSSARQGPIYYYFIYNPAKKKFILSPEPYPEMKLEPKKKIFRAQEGQFKIDKTYTIQPIKK